MTTTSLDSFNARQTLTVGDKEYTAYSIVEAEKNGLRLNVRQQIATVIGGVEHFAGFETLEPAAGGGFGAAARWPPAGGQKEPRGKRGNEIGETAEAHGMGRARR